MPKACTYCENERLFGECNKTILKTALKLNGLLLANQEVFVEHNKLVLFINNYEEATCYEYKSAKIKYCPMCGRRLNTETPKE